MAGRAAEGLRHSRQSCRDYSQCAVGPGKRQPDFNSRRLIMKLNSRGGWIAAGAAAYVLFLLITLPASLVVARLAKHGVISSATTGSVWHGQVTGLQVGVLNLGNAEWNMR